MTDHVNTKGQQYCEIGEFKELNDTVFENFVTISARNARKHELGISTYPHIRELFHDINGRQGMMEEYVYTNIHGSRVIFRCIVEPGSNYSIVRISR
jgi:hypothetical protein